MTPLIRNIEANNAESFSYTFQVFDNGMPFELGENLVCCFTKHNFIRDVLKEEQDIYGFNFDFIVNDNTITISYPFLTKPIQPGKYNYFISIESEQIILIKGILSIQDDFSYHPDYVLPTIITV